MIITSNLGANSISQAALATRLSIISGVSVSRPMSLLRKASIDRSEERRVGKACYDSVQSGGVQYRENETR